VRTEPAIYSVRLDGSGLQRLTSGGGQALYPAWSRDGRQIAFSSGITAGSELWVMAADGGNARRLSPDFRDCGYGYTSLTWDPSATRLAAECFGNVSVFDVRSGTATSVSTGLEDTMTDPDWSPDGTRLAFTAPSSPDVFTRAPDGSGRARLLSDASDPAWSPNGSRLAFVGGTTPGIFVANVDGTGRTRLTSPEDAAFDEGPTWAPDGQWLAFHRRSTVCVPPTVPPTVLPDRVCFPHWSVFVVRSDGSGLRRLTPDSLYATRPAW
jgi:TolB protein